MPPTAAVDNIMLTFRLPGVELSRDGAGTRISSDQISCEKTGPSTIRTLPVTIDPATP
jgi:hypothetical protein